MKKRLTEIAVQRLAPDPKKRLEIFDQLALGLVLRVTPNCKKTWSMMYRVAGAAADGKRGPLRRHTLGSYPLLDLKTARARHHDAMELVERGLDPAVQRQKENEGRHLRLFGNVLERFIELHAKPNTKKWRDTQKILKRAFDYGWREKDISQLGRAEVHELLDRIIEDRGKSYASEMRRRLSKLFNWAVDRGLIPASPMAGMRRPELRYIARERVLEMDEIAVIWQAAEKMGYPFGPMIRLLILTGQRRSEIAGLRRAWLNNDGTSFEIPASEYKTNRNHVVPLQRTSQEIIAAQPIWNHGDYLFSTKGGKSPVSGFSKAKSRLGKICGITDWTLHDLRRSVATHMARIGVSQEHIERVLGHVIEGVAGTYNRYSYLEEKLDALARWESELIGWLPNNSHSRQTETEIL